MKKFELIPHTADLKIRAFGSSKEELFKNALIAMFSSCKPKSQYLDYDNEQAIVSKFNTERPVIAEAGDFETLLIEFLSECLYLSDTNKEAYFDVEFETLNSTSLQAIVKGITIEGFDEPEIKAVTYHDLTLEEDIKGQWQATIVFDI